MPIFRMKEIREMPSEERDKKLKDMKNELINERATAAMGGAPASPGKIRALRKTIAKILTVMNEEEKKSE